MKKIILAIILTSIFWWGISKLASGADDITNTSSYTEDIIGEWEPIEESECNISFSKYGIMTQQVNSFIPLKLESPYSINGDIITITQKKDDNEKELIDFRVVINTKEDGTYLEIYGVTKLSGLYRKKELNQTNTTPIVERPTTNEVSQPTKTSSTASQTNSTTEPNEEKPKVASKNIEQPKEEKQTSLTKILPNEQPSLPNSQPKLNTEHTLSAEDEIVGKWQPVTGAEYPLEFTKYGAVIQIHNSFQMRYEYATTGQNMKIRYDMASFKILKEGGDTYLEIYNSTDFSGRYKRVSRPLNINTTILSKDEYPTLIVGRWNPINGQEYPIEFTQFGTAIQIHNSFDMRYEYSLSNDKLTIRYDKNARVVISEDANSYYLEIFNTTDFSGRYKKSK